MKCLVAVIGPTAVGKSQLALRLAQDFSGEIVNADSRQVYRNIDIGTAKPSQDELSAVRHHLIDIINPDEPFSLAIYQKMVYEAIDDIQQRNKLPVLVGGSGLYVWSVIEGWKIPPVAPDTKLRLDLEARARKEGGYTLYEELQKIDPVAATKIMPTNIRRVIRALEVCKTTGQTASHLWQKQPPLYPILIIGLTMQRDDLYRKIDARVDEMIKQGLINEVKDLIAKGYSLDIPAMSGIGYKQIGMFIEGQIDLNTAVDQIKKATHRFARHQYAWFRLNDDRIHWLSEYEDIQREANKLVASFLSDIHNKEVKT